LSGENRIARRRLASVAAGDASWLGRYEYDVNGFITKLDEGTLCATDSTLAYDDDTAIPQLLIFFSPNRGKSTVRD